MQRTRALALVSVLATNTRHKPMSEHKKVRHCHWLRLPVKLTGYWIPCCGS
jgi:hypothetical protein